MNFIYVRNEAVFKLSPNFFLYFWLKLYILITSNIRGISLFTIHNFAINEIADCNPCYYYFFNIRLNTIQLKISKKLEAVTNNAHQQTFTIPSEKKKKETTLSTTKISFHPHQYLLNETSATARDITKVSYTVQWKSSTYRRACDTHTYIAGAVSVRLE